MKIRFDREADALYIRFDDAPVAESAEVSPGIVLDYDAEARMVGLEVLDASKHLSPDGLRRVTYEILEPAA